MSMKIEHQIAEVARECALRRNVYPGFVQRGKMRQSEADEHQARMEAALETLKLVREYREQFLALIRENVSRVASEATPKET